MDCQSHLHQIGLGVQQYFDDWNGQFFLHHPFDADVSAQRRRRRLVRRDLLGRQDHALRQPGVRQRGDRQGRHAGRRREDLPLPVRHLVRPAVHRSDDRAGRRHREPDELPDELAPDPQDPPLRALELPPIPARDRPLELRRVQRAEREASPPTPTPTPGRTTTTSGSAPASSTPGSPGTATGPRTSSTSTATPSRLKADAYPAIFPGGACLTDPSFYP